MKTIEQFHKDIQWENHAKTHRLYAIIDCAHKIKDENVSFEAITKLPPDVCRSLFEGTPEEEHVLLAPYLIHAAHPKYHRMVEWLVNLEVKEPMVLWLASTLEIEALSENLKPLLEAKMPDGKDALLRFYDPRVLTKLMGFFDQEQKKPYFKAAATWWAWDIQESKRLTFANMDVKV